MAAYRFQKIPPMKADEVQAPPSVFRLVENLLTRCETGAAHPDAVAIAGVGRPLVKRRAELDRQDERFLSDQKQTAADDLSG